LNAWARAYASMTDFSSPSSSGINLLNSGMMTTGAMKLRKSCILKTDDKSSIDNISQNPYIYNEMITIRES